MSIALFLEIQLLLPPPPKKSQHESEASDLTAVGKGVGEVMGGVFPGKTQKMIPKGILDSCLHFIFLV